MRSPIRGGSASRAGAAAALLMLLLAGCSAGSDSAGTSAGSAADEAAPEPGQAPADQGGGSSGSGAGSGSGSAVTVPERKITRSEVGVEVDDLSRAAQQVRDLTAANGGEVSDESIGLSRTASSSSYDGSYGSYGSSGSSGDIDGTDGIDVGPAVTAFPGEARLVLRVPPDAAEETVNEIAALGTETGRWTSSTSVETTLVDLESRIATQTTAVEQAQGLMDRATTLADIVLLENEVNSRTAELESLKARQASIEGQSERATVTAVLQTRERTEEVEDAAGFLGGLRAGWGALLASVGVILTILGAVLPFAVVGLLVGYPVYRVLRRRRANRPAPVLAHAGPPQGFASAQALDRPVQPPRPQDPPAPPQD